MERIVRRFGLLVMLAASLTVAGHIFEHCTANSANALINCPVCQSFTASSMHAVQAAATELVFLRDAILPVSPEYYFSPARTGQPRAPPPAVIS